MPNEFKHEIKIYYEDTDSGGVVYYSNYLNFLERARTEMIESVGLSNKKLLEEYKTLIIVKSCNIEYVSPAKLEDKIQIYSSIESLGKASFVVIQNINKDDDLIAKAKLKLVTVNQEGKPVKIPSVLEKQFINYLS
jgi:acyl-CoA thioester hydrolase|tara:strand:+ start:1647 stop:2054 length:408 start_codon:yes stop_codon:yes gene_type:complete